VEECGKARKGCWPLVVACGLANGGREAMGQGGEGHGTGVLWSLEEDALVVSRGAHGKAAVDGVGGCERWRRIETLIRD